MPSLLAEQRIGIEYAPITTVTEEREADWRIILRIYIKRKKQKTKTKNKGNNTAADTAILTLSSCPVLCSVSRLVVVSIGTHWGGRGFVT